MVYLWWKYASVGCTAPQAGAAEQQATVNSLDIVRPILRVNEPKNTGARSARGRSAAKNLVEQYKQGADSSK